MKLALMLTMLATTVAFAQPPAGKVEVTRVFEGTVNVRGAKPAPVRVAIYSWVIRERQRIATVELPLRGTAIVQVRAGTVTSFIGAERRPRQTGDFFTVPAGVPWGLETEGDTAIVEAVVVAE
ncbi:hypothetical protein SAMN04487926_1198 [Paraburkholderia steynii]|uniref:Cupin n=1 Tax=Paraburkholderia steynii TaxID=1245441 RepID=A0A7Z7BB95_9BURK|nr:hypothetical protein [Paraburkholderia steynii]SDI55015.1 hypothetical protein SAMN04487926_1198 [Paraburkholderia steynii]